MLGLLVKGVLHYIKKNGDGAAFLYSPGLISYSVERMFIRCHAYQNRMHPHVDSAYTDQDTPAESHTKAKEERVL